MKLSLAYLSLTRVEEESLEPYYSKITAAQPLRCSVITATIVTRYNNNGRVTTGQNGVSRTSFKANDAEGWIN